MRFIRLPLEDMYLSNQLVMCKKILRKFEPAFRAIAKKIEPQVKKWFSYKKSVFAPQKEKKWAEQLEKIKFFVYCSKLAH